MIEKEGTFSSGDGRVGFRIPNDVFEGNTLVIAREARDAYFQANPTDFEHFKQDSNLAVSIKRNGSTTVKYECYRKGSWHEITGVLSP